MKKLCTALLGLACCTLSAQNLNSRPDFNGTWKLRVAKSFMGSEHAKPNFAYTKIIAVQQDHFSITNIQVNANIVNIPLPDSRTTTELTLNGTEQDQEMAGAFPGTPSSKVKVSGEWQGSTIFIQQRGQMFGGAMTSHERYFLSPDGSQLIELIERHGVSGDKEQRLVFER